MRQITAGTDSKQTHEVETEKLLYMQELTASRLTTNDWSFINKIPHSHMTLSPWRTDVATSLLKLKLPFYQQTVRLPHFDVRARKTTVLTFSFPIWCKAEVNPGVCVGPCDRGVAFVSVNFHRATMKATVSECDLRATFALIVFTQAGNVLMVTPAIVRTRGVWYSALWSRWYIQ